MNWEIVFKVSGIILGILFWAVITTALVVLGFELGILQGIVSVAIMIVIPIFIIAAIKNDEL